MLTIVLPTIGPVERARRLAHVLWRALPLIASLLRDRRRWLVAGAPVERSAADHERRARRLVTAIAELGPTFVKLAQMAAARADLLPGPYVEALASLLDQVPAVPWPAIERTLRAAYGPDTTAVFRRIDQAPLAAGSLGQVHAAVLAGEPAEREVVIKVLRPGIARVVARDLAVLRTITGWVQRRFPHPHVEGFRVVLDQFERHVADELDFRREAEATEAIRRRLGADGRIRIPAVVPGLTRVDVLVLERVHGTRIDRLDAAALAPGQLDQLVERLVEAYIRMMLIDGQFHADPHPGNLWLAPDGALVFLDFGMVSEVPLETRRHLLRTVIASIRRDATAVAEGFAALDMLVPGTSAAMFTPLAARLLEIGYAPLTSGDRAQLVADEVMRELYAWPITLPPPLVYFARTAALIEGVGARYDARFNSVATASRVVLRLYPQLARALGESVWSLPPDAVATVAGAMAGTAARAAVTRVRRLERAVSAALTATVAALLAER